MLSNNEKVSLYLESDVVLPRVRVRGIYSTALTKLLLDHDFEIVQSSTVARERFKLRDTDAELSPDLDVYDRLDRQGVYAVGETTLLDSLISVLKSLLEDVIVRRRAALRAMESSTLACSSIILESTARGVGNSSLGSKLDSINIEFPAMSKKKLDALRSLVTPTIEGHHYFKACGGKISYLLGMAEKMLEKDAPRSEVENLLKESIRAEYPCLNSRIDIEHVKIDGRLFHLDNAQIVDFDEDKGSLRLRRTFKRKGFYDGLRIRKDPDDYALTDLRIGDWTFRTSYFSCDGQYKGTYVNLNTPIELYSDKIRYVDLEADVCLWPDGKIEKLDLDKLEDKVSKGYVSEGLEGIVRRKLKEIMNSISPELTRNKGPD